MRELEIPERALTTAAIQDWPMNIQAASPIVVAAELRSMLDEDKWPCKCPQCIRTRADELDPQHD